MTDPLTKLGVRGHLQRSQEETNQSTSSNSVGLGLNRLIDLPHNNQNDRFGPNSSTSFHSPSPLSTFTAGPRMPPVAPEPWLPLQSSQELSLQPPGSSSHGFGISMCPLPFPTRLVPSHWLGWLPLLLVSPEGSLSAISQSDFSSPSKERQSPCIPTTPSLFPVLILTI